MTLTTMVRDFWADEDGGEAVEWPLVVALVIVGVVALWTPIRTALTAVLAAIAGALNDAI